MVFAAGLGTRLKPITDSLPKALVPVCGQPLLWHVLQVLRAAGYDEAVVNVHHFADKIRAYLDSRDFGMKIEISDETDLLRETGGAIKHARKLLEGESFLVHNVDILSDLDLEWFRGQARPESLATLLVSERKTQRYFLFDNDMRLVGWTNLATGEVRSPWPGLKAEECRRYAFAGIHQISPAVFTLFDEYGYPERFPIVDFYLQACRDHEIRGVAPENLRIVDVGKLDTLQKAEEMVQL